MRSPSFRGKDRNPSFGARIAAPEPGLHRMTGWPASLWPQVIACDLPDKFDNASPQPWRLYSHERLSEREPVARGEELGYMRGHCATPIPSGCPGSCGAPSKKNGTGICRISEMCCRRLAPMRFFPLSYFCSCCMVSPRLSPSFSWLIPSINRRNRTRLPTCLSTGLGAFLTIRCFTIHVLAGRVASSALRGLSC
jgi:hypothetical protein